MTLLDDARIACDDCGAKDWPTDCTCVHPIPVGNFRPGSDEWNHARANRLGGSEIAAVLGLSSFETRFRLWHAKKGLVTPEPENPQMEWGNRLEPLVLGKFFEGDGRERDNSRTGSYSHPQRPWQLATPDGYLLNGPMLELVEAKTARDDLGWGEPGTGEIPVGYRCQTLWNLDVMGARRCWVPVLIGGSDYREYLIDLDTDADANADLRVMLAAGEQFIADLATGVRPDIDDSEITYQVVRELHPEIEPVDVEVDPELAGAYLDAVINQKEAAARLKGTGARVLDALGTARNAVVDGQRFAYRTAKKKADGSPGVPYITYDQKRMKQLTAKTIQGVSA